MRITKKFEEQICDSLDNLKDFFKDREILGEITIVIKGIDKKQYSRNQRIRY